MKAPTIVLATILAMAVVGDSANMEKILQDLGFPTAAAKKPAVNPTNKAPDKGKGSKFNPGQIEAPDPVNAMTDALQKSEPKGNKLAAEVSPTKKAPWKGKGTKLSSGPGKPLDIVNAILAHASQESGPKGKGSTLDITTHHTNDVPEVTEGTNFTPVPSKGLDTAHTITPSSVGTEDIGITDRANMTPTSKVLNNTTWTKFTVGPTQSLDPNNATTTASEKSATKSDTFLVRKENDENDQVDYNYGSGDSFLVRKENGENDKADYNYGEIGSGDSFLVRKENGKQETKDYNYEDRGSGNDVGSETEDYNNEKRGRDMTTKDETFLVKKGNGKHGTEADSYGDGDTLIEDSLEEDGSADTNIYEEPTSQRLRGVSAGHVKRQEAQVAEYLAPLAAGIGEKIADKLGDRLANSIVENYQDKVVGVLQDYVGKQTDKFDDKYKDLLKDTSGLAAGLDRTVKEADIQLVPKPGATMGNMYAPPGWEIRHTYKYKDDSDGGKGSSSGQAAAYTYPAGLGPVLMNGCYGTGYKKDDPCWRAKIPRTGCYNLVDGATYLGVGFDGRGVYSAESRKKSVIQRSCDNLQTYGKNEVPDSMTLQGIYDTDVQTHTFSSMEHYRHYLEEKSSVTSGKAMFQEEIDQTSGHVAVSPAFGFGWSLGVGTSSQSDTSSKSSNFNAMSSAQDQLNEEQTQTFLAMLEMNVFRYEIFMDDVKPEQLNVGFLRDFITLPQSYFSPGAEILFQNFYLRWGTHYVKSAIFGGQLKITKAKRATEGFSLSEFATRAEADWKMTLTTFTARASQFKSSSIYHDSDAKTASQQSSGQVNSQSNSHENDNQLQKASSQEYSSERLMVQGGDPKIAAAITEMYKTSLATELKDWLESIKDNPKPFFFVLRRVSDLLNIPIASLFPAGNVDYGCFGRRDLKIEMGTGRKYYTENTTKTTANKNDSETVTVSEIRYCDFADLKALEDSMNRRRLSLQRAVTVYLDEDRLLSSDFLLPAGKAGCETATLAYLQGSNNGIPKWKEMIGGNEFTVIFDMPYDIPRIIKAQDVLQLKFIRHKWFSTRRGSVPHLYDGYNNGGRIDGQEKKVSVQGLVMTYKEETGIFTVTDDDFKGSASIIPDLPEWVKGREIARAEYTKLLNHLSKKIDTVGDVPCSIHWSNLHRLDPTDGGKCIHFSAASEGNIFVVFASIPQNHETWVYIQISPEGVALYKAMRIQTTQLNGNAGGLGSATLYQSYFVCVTEDVKETTTVIQYGKTPDKEERPHVWLSFTFHESASLQYYSFGNGASPVKVLGLSIMDKPAKDFIICREGTEMINGICQQKCHAECHGCRTSGSNSATDCIACKHLKVSWDGKIGSFECVAQCPRHMEASNATKICTCIKRMEEARPGGVADCVTECPLTHFEDNDVCKKCSSFCKDNSAIGKKVCSGPASNDCDTCKYKHEGRCVKECKPGQKAVKTSANDAFTCHQCRAGHECKLGDEREDICPAGTASNDNRTMCEPCAAGEFSSSPGATFCHKCPAGQYSRGGGSTKCLPCPKGKYNSVAGSTGCTFCSAGKYSSAMASASCRACPAGKYSSTLGSTTCKTCPAGKYSSQGSAKCSACPAGKYSNRAASPSCRACPAGKFSSGAASKSCRVCPPRLTSRSGSSKCTCPSGYTKFQRSCFKSFSDEKSFGFAENQCKADGGDLAMPKDQATNTFLTGLGNKIIARRKFYIGLTDLKNEGQWVYVDGSRLGTYKNWRPGEPNNYRRRNEDCVELWWNGWWNDVPCYFKYRFHCELKLPRGHY